MARGEGCWGMLRIISGEYKSRLLLSPPDDTVTRPYSTRVREAVFNIFQEWWAGASVLDLFAGVGSMGLEAVSREAKSVVFVEKDRRIFGLLEQNIESLGCAGRVSAMLGDALGSTALLRASRPVDIVFIDPPYLMMKDKRTRGLVLEQISRCREIMNPKGFAILRTPLDPEEVSHEVEGFEGPEVRDYGRTGMRVLLYQPGG